MICITCVDALLGTDMERVCHKAEEYAGVPVKAMLYVCTDQRGQKTTDGACAAVRLFVAGTEKEKKETW